ncbi:MAG: glutaredoxin 3 [Pseudomonadota bacterium]
MTKVTVYTRAFCPYCSRAMSLLSQKPVSVDEIDAGMSPQLKSEMIQKSGGAQTFPQIFVGDVHVGGCDELFALDRAGKLDPLIESQGS